jgi:aspartyl-tRNA(Asn)/glutamyl-tRNA(Gln) amidotransferase subunit A
MTRTVADAALMLTISAGRDARDPYSLSTGPADYTKALGGRLKGLRIAYADDLGFVDALDPEVQAACGKAARAFRELGCRLETVAPKWPSPRDAWQAIFCGGIATRLQPYLDRRSEIDPGLLRLVEGELAAPPTKFVRAWFDRLAWMEHPRRLFEKYDLLLTPTVACPAFPVGQDDAAEIAGRPVDPYAWTPFTWPFNLTGQPAATVPAGFTADGLPIGLQIVGRHEDDVTVLRAAAAFERARPWSQHRPVEMGGPEMAPHTRPRSEAPRQSRGAPR